MSSQYSVLDMKFLYGKPQNISWVPSRTHGTSYSQSKIDFQMIFKKQIKLQLLYVKTYGVLWFLHGMFCQPTLMTD